KEHKTQEHKAQEHNQHEHAHMGQPQNQFAPGPYNSQTGAPGGSPVQLRENFMGMGGNQGMAPINAPVSAQGQYPNYAPVNGQGQPGPVPQPPYATQQVPPLQQQQTTYPAQQAPPMQRQPSQQQLHQQHLLQQQQQQQQSSYPTQQVPPLQLQPSQQQPTQQQQQPAYPTQSLQQQPSQQQLHQQQTFQQQQQQQQQQPPSPPVVIEPTEDERRDHDRRQSSMSASLAAGLSPDSKEAQAQAQPIPGSPASEAGSRLSTFSVDSEIRNLQVIARAQAMFDFAGEDEGDLAFKVGDIINVIAYLNDDWWRGTLRKDVGIFPTAYVQKL
ncbi:hypothetical protein BG000_006010, partial [Podila horticola]